MYCTDIFILILFLLFTYIYYKWYSCVQEAVEQKENSAKERPRAQSFSQPAKDQSNAIAVQQRSAADDQSVAKDQSVVVSDQSASPGAVTDDSASQNPPTGGNQIPENDQSKNNITRVSSETRIELPTAGTSSDSPERGSLIARLTPKLNSNPNEAPSTTSEYIATDMKRGELEKVGQLIQAGNRDFSARLTAEQQ